MYISPVRLESLCLCYIADNLFTLTKRCLELGRLSLEFHDNEIYFHSNISEGLLVQLGKSGKLTDLSLTLFRPQSTRLKSVRITNASGLTKEGLRVLKGHKIVNLEVSGLKFNVNDLVACLGEWTLNNLRALNVSRSTFTEGSRHCVMIALSKLKNLQTLDVSGTEFNRHNLDIVVEDLPLLENLDISSTRVDDISPLMKCKERLKHLIMYNLKVIVISSSSEVITELSNLRTLDVSEDKDNYTFEVFEPGGASMVNFLNSPQSLPHLTSLDISGKGGIDRRALDSFLTHHKSLSYLGIVNREICTEERFTNPKHPQYNPRLRIGGIGNEEQIITSLRRYSTRTLYVQKCLYNLFRLTQTFSQPRSDIIELVLIGSELNRESCGVQMAATACLYNLTKGELGSKVHPQILSRVVSLCLTAMENFPGHYQLQKNTLLTLCSDRILQDVPIDRYATAKLVLESLCTFEDPSMNRMSVAICSILAAKISTKETSELGSNASYMHKLLRLVRSKKASRTIDLTMKFTLSALWNLTDESPTTCGVFLNEGGLQLFLEVLQTFPGETSVETKVLGLINNIAEVPNLRHWLLHSFFISTLRGLLHSKHIDVSYFAAGIMAHLAAEGESAWSDCEVSRKVILEELGQVVSSWDSPEGEMVAYRSFFPFISLLGCNDAPQVQLWAVWAIHHVCTKNPQRYCPMLEAESGSRILMKMLSDSSVDPRVREICARIKILLESFSASSDVWLQQSAPNPNPR